MKAKLVKYPFSEKKYRWDTWYQGKEFQYFWDESLPNNFETIEPYIETKDFVYDDENDYSYIDISKAPRDFTSLQPNKSETTSIWGDDVIGDNRYYYGFEFPYTPGPSPHFQYTFNGFHTSFTNHVGGCYRMYEPSEYYDKDIDCNYSLIKLPILKRVCHFRKAGYSEYTDIEYDDNTEVKVEGNLLTIGNNTYVVASVSGSGVDCHFRTYIDYENISPRVVGLLTENNITNNRTLDILTVNEDNYNNYFTQSMFQRIITEKPNLNFVLNQLGETNFSYYNWYDGVTDNSYLSIIYNSNSFTIRINNLTDVSVSGFTYNEVNDFEECGFTQEYKRIIADLGIYRWTPDLSYTLEEYGYPDYYIREHCDVIDTFYDPNDTTPINPTSAIRWEKIPKYVIPQTISYNEYQQTYAGQPFPIYYGLQKNSTFQQGSYNLLKIDITITPNDEYSRISTLPYVVNINDWNLDLKNVCIVKGQITGKTLLEPNLALIGDKTDNSITIPEGNNSILSYNLGQVINNEFVLKTLQLNAPCEYENNEVSSKTWMTYNSYTASEWVDGFHYQGEQWNNIGSPFAYINGITSASGSKKMYYTFQSAEAGTYVNVFSLINGGFEVKDSSNNSYISKTDELEDYRHYYDDNVGSLWYFGSGTVSSTDRHAYPDAGYQDYYSYILRPQDTKFLRYYRTRDEVYNVELWNNRYNYTHDTVDFCDRSYEGTVCGTTTSTGEDNIPDGTWREYLGLYLGTSIPFLGIVETEIPPADILGVPQYDKQVNTSDTLKYGTVASASLTFTLNKPVGETLQHNNELLILYYDFKHRDEWERLGFFRVDSIEALDENTTSLLAHDEVYKLNKYVDDFLEAYTQTTTLDLFYRDLLNYCGCFYDTHQDIIHNGILGMTNVYHAVKTTGIQVAHYVANLSPGFIHANIDGDVVLSQYKLKDDDLTIADYSNLVYTAYDTDMLNKIKIVSSNAVKGEDNGTGTNVYFLADNPLLSELNAVSYFNDLAQNILEVYEDIPTYRPATVDFLILPRELKIGDIVNLTTPKSETYKIIVMAMTISSSGVEIKSFGTQSYPVEAESNSEFVNLINDMGEISGDVSNMMEAQRSMAAEIVENREDISANTTEIEAIKTKNTQQDNTLSSHTISIGNLQTLTNGYGVSVANKLATITLNGTTQNIALKDYVDDRASLAEDGAREYAKDYADSLIGGSVGYKTGTIYYTLSSTATGTNYQCHCMFIGTNDERNGLFIPTEFMANDGNNTHLFRVYNGNYFVLKVDGSREGWFQMYNVSFY